MSIKPFHSKRAAFRDLTRAITVGNTFFFIVMLLIIIFTGSFLSNKIFGTSIIPVGTPFKFLLIGAGLTLTYYIIVRHQGNLDRQDIFGIILVGGFIILAFIYLPKLLPEIFTNSAFTQSVLATNSNSPFVIISNVSTEVHQSIQAIIPIP